MHGLYHVEWVLALGKDLVTDVGARGNRVLVDVELSSLVLRRSVFIVRVLEVTEELLEEEAAQDDVAALD